MKRIEDVDNLIRKIQSDYDHITTYLPTSDKRKTKLLSKKYCFLMKIKLYLESNPREDFLKKNKEDIERKLDKITENFELEFKFNENLKLKDYQKKMGVNELKTKLKTINFILKD
jgi:hypothetical protein